MSLSSSTALLNFMSSSHRFSSNGCVRDVQENGWRLSKTNFTGTPSFFAASAMTRCRAMRLGVLSISTGLDMFHHVSAKCLNAYA